MARKFDVIVVGGGIIGASIAYHLGQLGRQRVCLLERGTLTCGTTWHAAGLVAELRATPSLTQLARYSGALYERLESAGHGLGFRRAGAVTLALEADRVIELKRQAAMARSLDVDCRWLDAAEIAGRWPALHAADVRGGVFMPGDGQTNPVDTTRVLAQLARAAGVEIREHIAVRSLHVERGRLRGVDTEDGRLEADRVVLAAGLWTRALARTAGVDVPLYPCEHSYAVTESFEPAAGLPIVRVPDDGVYLKPDAGRMLIGCFEREAKPLNPDSLPADFSFDELPFDLEQFAPYLERGVERVAGLADTGIRTWFNGPESFTPDGRYILGESPQLANLFVAAGFNSIGIQSAGGVGWALAHWIDQGHAPIDLWDVDIRRFVPGQNADAYLASRAAESLGLLYAMHWPYRQPQSARDMRRSPLHERTAARGACFGELAGWERPNWYAAADQAPRYEWSYGRQNWFENAAREHRRVREDVALFDQSSFGKLRIAGPDACRFLNRLCTADLDVAPGRIVYCQCLNERGGIEADVTITRLAADAYLYVTAAASAVRDQAWLSRQAEGFDVEIADVSGHLAVLGVMGPHSRVLLEKVTAADLSNAGFPFATAQTVQVAGVMVRAMRITYVGALGWELYVAAADAGRVFDCLSEETTGEAADHGLMAGYHAMDSLRLEKGYRHWGHDIGDTDTPLESGLAFTVAWDKPGGFLGRDALLEQQRAGVTRRLLGFHLGDAEAPLFHDEPIWLDDRPVGHITSGAFGHSVNAWIGLGWISLEQPFLVRDLNAGVLEIEVAGTRVRARASARPLFDPGNELIHR